MALVFAGPVLVAGMFALTVGRVYGLTALWTSALFIASIVPAVVIWILARVAFEWVRQPRRHG
jgi:hypothetical protein